MRKATLIFALALFVGCNSSNDGAVAPQPTAFPQFVRDQVAATADDTEPVNLDNIVFVDQLVADDYADLLQ